MNQPKTIVKIYRDHFQPRHYSVKVIDVRPYPGMTTASAWHEAPTVFEAYRAALIDNGIMRSINRRVIFIRDWSTQRAYDDLYIEDQRDYLSNRAAQYPY